VKRDSFSVSITVGAYGSAFGAAAVAADVGKILEEELGADPETGKFCNLAQHYWKIS